MIITSAQRTTACAVITVAALAIAIPTPAAAKSCEELRALCHTMRDDKNDCTKPYQRCLATGVFVTPLGRVFKATK
jgi:hypothetical protein